MTLSPNLWDVTNESRKNAPIAVLDSGVGGISLLRELKRILPHEDLLYLGDAKHAPYGEQDADTLRTLLLTHAKSLLPRAKALVLACNTATAVGAEALRKAYPTLPIVGMEPAVKPALAVGAHPRILILATHATLREEKLALLLHRYRAEADFTLLAAPKLVEFVEKEEADTAPCRDYLAALFAPFHSSPPDAIVLGCTHFPFAKAAISACFSHPVPLFDGTAGTAKQVAHVLAEKNLCNPQMVRGTVTFTATDSTAIPRYLRAFLAK